MKGVKFGKNCFVNKLPYVRKYKGSQIIVGNNVVLTSNRRHNPLLEHPIRLQTLNKNAIIELKQNSGISGVSLVAANRITIGENTIIGANTLIYDSDGHTYSPETGWNTPRLQTGRPITIGNKCFIGSRCIILGGVTIGDRCLISAGSVITQNIPSGSKAYGNPAVITPLPKSLGGEETEPNSQLRDDFLTETTFLTRIKTELELDRKPELHDVFSNYEEWDSLSLLCLTTLLKDEYNIVLTSEMLNSITTWQHLYDLILSQKRTDSKT